MLAPETLEEQILQFLFTGVSNFFILPTLWIMKKQGLSLQYNIGIFTTLCSFLYHSLDSFSNTYCLYLDEREWHRLDNVGSILCLSALLLYMTGFPMNLQIALLSFQIIVALIVQEWAPWIVWTAAGPVAGLSAVILILFIGSCLCCQKSLPRQPVRNKVQLLIGILTMAVAIFCFSKGLKNEDDYLRMWHGMWHLLVCLPSFYLWQIHSSEPYSMRQFFKEFGPSFFLK